MTTPCLSLYWHWHAKKRAQICDRVIEFAEVHIQRLAFGAPRLLVESDPFDVEPFKDRFIQELARVVGIFRLHCQLDAADEVRNEPVKPHQIVIAQKALDSRRLETSLG